jgi:probable HAF family extracellular repeat protein
LGGATSHADDVNNLNQVVGWAETAAEESHAFRWEDGNGNRQTDPGEMIDLGTLGGAQSFGRGINDQGWVVGSAYLDGTECHPFLWKDDNGNRQADPGEMIDLGTLAPWPAAGEALAINDLGQIVGSAWVPDYASHAFVITPEDMDDDGVPDRWFRDDNGDGSNDLMVDLGVLPTNPNVNDCPNCRSSQGVSINRFGWIAGTSNAYDPTHETNRDHAMAVVPFDVDGDGYGDLWYADANADYVNDLMINLTTLGRIASEATGVNDAGQICGRSADPLFDSHPILWEFDGRGNLLATDLGIPKGFEGAVPKDINNQSETVGFAKKKHGAAHFDLEEVQDREAFLWQNGKRVAIESLVANLELYGDLDDANAINDDSAIVGNERLGDTIYDPVRAWIALPIQ